VAWQSFVIVTIRQSWIRTLPSYLSGFTYFFVVRIDTNDSILILIPVEFFSHMPSQRYIGTVERIRYQRQLWPGCELFSYPTSSGHHSQHIHFWFLITENMLCLGDPHPSGSLMPQKSWPSAPAPEVRLLRKGTCHTFILINNLFRNELLSRPYLNVNSNRQSGSSGRAPAYQALSLNPSTAKKKRKSCST
jgi:hypothetical protein